MNIDTTWFAPRPRRSSPPVTLEDLTEPVYRDLLVLPGPRPARPGLAFLLTTVAAFGDEWPAYWEDLLDNGAKLTQGWSDAYQVDFTQGGGGGDRPIVLSYDSSPAFTIDESGASTTQALLDTCFQQVEYAGVLAGAANPDGARALLEFLRTTEVQEALPDAMYVFPVDANAKLPARVGRVRGPPGRAVDGRPGRDRRQPGRVAHRVERPRLEVTSSMTAACDASSSSPGWPSGRSWSSASSSCSRCWGCWPRGCGRTASSTRVRCSTCWPGPAPAGCVWFTVWSAGLATLASVLLGMPAAYALHRLDFRGRGLIRAVLLVPFVLPTSGRRRRVPAAVGRGRSAGVPRPGRDPGRDRRRAHLLQRGRGHPCRRGELGVPGRAPGRGRGRARRLAPSGVPDRDAARLCDRRWSRRPAWCSCSAPPRSASS